jgi:hypothetical protein
VREIWNVDRKRLHLQVFYRAMLPYNRHVTVRVLYTKGRLYRTLSIINSNDSRPVGGGKGERGEFALARGTWLDARACRSIAIFLREKFLKKYKTLAYIGEIAARDASSLPLSLFLWELKEFIHNTRM